MGREALSSEETEESLGTVLPHPMFNRVSPGWCWLGSLAWALAGWAGVRQCVYFPLLVLVL